MEILIVLEECQLQQELMRIQQSWDGITGAKIALAAGYAITTGKYVSGARDTDFTTDWFYFVVNTDTATTGGIEGGGYPVSVGPVTIEA
jgi:hypothetical protein